MLGMAIILSMLCVSLFHHGVIGREEVPPCLPSTSCLRGPAASHSTRPTLRTCEPGRLRTAEPTQNMKPSPRVCAPSRSECKKGELVLFIVSMVGRQFVHLPAGKGIDSYLWSRVHPADGVQASFLQSSRPSTPSLKLQPPLKL